MYRPEETKALFQRLYPDKWDVPVSVRSLQNLSIEHFACRICIGTYGLKGSSIKDLPTDVEQVWEHIQKEHGGRPR